MLNGFGNEVQWKTQSKRVSMAVQDRNSNKTVDDGFPHIFQNCLLLRFDGSAEQLIEFVCFPSCDATVSL